MKRRRFRVKRLGDGRAALNLACGAQMHPEWNNIDFSPLARLARHPRVAALLHRGGVLSEKRYRRLLATDPDLLCWDLRHGIPFEAETFDVVYHSHFLEHLDCRDALGLLGECRRVLKSSGVLRIVVPDLHQFCQDYLASYEGVVQQTDPSEELLRQHQQSISKLIRQMVAGEPAGTAEQPRMIRVLERRLRRDTVKAGEAHRWMYDRFSLCDLVARAGFTDIRVESALSGRIAAWPAFCLDADEKGCPHKSRSLYVEAAKGKDVTEAPQSSPSLRREQALP